MLNKLTSRIISLIILAIYTLTFGVNSVYAMSDAEHNIVSHGKHSKETRKIGHETKNLKSHNVASSKDLTKNIRAAALKLGGSKTASAIFVRQLKGNGAIQVNPETLQASSTIPLMPYALHGSANGTPSLNLSVKFSGNTSQRWILPYMEYTSNASDTHSVAHIYIGNSSYTADLAPMADQGDNYVQLPMFSGSLAKNPERTIRYNVYGCLDDCTRIAPNVANDTLSVVKVVVQNGDAYYFDIQNLWQNTPGKLIAITSPTGGLLSFYYAKDKQYPNNEDVTISAKDTATGKMYQAAEIHNFNLGNFGSKLQHYTTTVTYPDPSKKSISSTLTETLNNTDSNNQVQLSIHYPDLTSVDEQSNSLVTRTGLTYKIDDFDYTDHKGNSHQTVGVDELDTVLPDNTLIKSQFYTLNGSGPDFMGATVPNPYVISGNVLYNYFDYDQEVQNDWNDGLDPFFADYKELGKTSHGSYEAIRLYGDDLFTKNYTFSLHRVVDTELLYAKEDNSGNFTNILLNKMQYIDPDVSGYMPSTYDLPTTTETSNYSYDYPSGKDIDSPYQTKQTAVYNNANAKPTQQTVYKNGKKMAHVTYSYYPNDKINGRKVDYNYLPKSVTTQLYSGNTLLATEAKNYGKVLLRNSSNPNLFLPAFTTVSTSLNGQKISQTTTADNYGSSGLMGLPIKVTSTYHGHPVDVSNINYTDNSGLLGTSLTTTDDSTLASSSAPTQNTGKKIYNTVTGLLQESIGNEDKITTYAYDNIARVIEVNNYLNKAAMDSNTPYNTTKYTYQVNVTDSRIENVTLHNVSTMTTQDSYGYKTQNIYNAAGQLIEVRNQQVGQGQTPWYIAEKDTYEMSTNYTFHYWLEHTKTTYADGQSSPIETDTFSIPDETVSQTKTKNSSGQMIVRSETVQIQDPANNRSISYTITPDNSSGKLDKIAIVNIQKATPENRSSESYTIIPNSGFQYNDSTTGNNASLYSGSEVTTANNLLSELLNPSNLSLTQVSNNIATLKTAAYTNGYVTKDALGRVASTETMAKGDQWLRTENSYNLDQLQKTTQCLVASTATPCSQGKILSIKSYTYNPLGHLESISVGGGGMPMTQLATKTSTGFGYVVSQNSTKGKTSSVYNSDGTLKTFTDGDGNVTQYTYNAYGEKTSSEVNGDPSTKVSYEYIAPNDTVGADQFGRIYKISNQNATYIYTYYNDGQVKELNSTVSGKAFKVTYNLDQYGVLQSKTYTFNNGQTQTINYIYTPSGQLKTVAVLNSENYSETYMYNPNLSLSQITKVGDGSTMKVNLSTDSLGRQTSISYDLPTNYDIAYNESFDRMGRIDGIDLVTTPLKSGTINPKIANLAVKDNYTYYSGTGSLDNESCDGSGNCPTYTNGDPANSETYTYTQGMNNIKTIKQLSYLQSGNYQNTRTYIYGNKSHPSQLTGLQNTAQGNPSTQVQYDEAGNAKSTMGISTITYTDKQQTKSMTTSTGDEVSFDYGPEGRIVNKQINGKTEYSYIYGLNGNISIITDSSGNIRLVIPGGAEVYNTDGSINLYTNITSGKNYDGEYDMKNKKVMSFKVYSAFGKSRNLLKVNGVSQPGGIDYSFLGYNMESTDPTTGTQLLGHGTRSYDPASRTFLQSDSESPWGQGESNGYAYVGYDPTMNSDPSGHSAVGDFFKGELHGVVNMVLGVIGGTWNEDGSVSWAKDFYGWAIGVESADAWYNMAYHGFTGRNAMTSMMGLGVVVDGGCDIWNGDYYGLGGQVADAAGEFAIFIGVSELNKLREPGWERADPVRGSVEEEDDDFEMGSGESVIMKGGRADTTEEDSGDDSDEYRDKVDPLTSKFSTWKGLKKEIERDRQWRERTTERCVQRAVKKYEDAKEFDATNKKYEMGLDTSESVKRAREGLRTVLNDASDASRNGHFGVRGGNIREMVNWYREEFSL